MVGGKVPVDISTSVGSMNVNAFPTANLGQQPVANSLSVTPASDIADPTYIGDIRFGEALPVGDNVIGKVKIDQAIPGTTNLVNVNGGASQTADIKVTLDSESVAVTGPLTNAELTAQALATEATLGTMQADIALMKADLASVACKTYKGADRTTTTGAAEELTIPANSKRAIISCAPSSQAYIEINGNATTSSPLYIEDPFGPLVLDLGSVTKLSAWLIAGNLGVVFFG